MTGVYFILVSICWGLTWYAMRIHALSEVGAGPSIGYRFLLAAALVYLFCWLRKIPMTHTWREHILLAGQGLCMCSLNFYFCYLAVDYIPSGLVSIGFSTLVFMNVFNNSLFFKTPISLKTILAACIGFAGMLLLFLPYLGDMHANKDCLLGLTLCLMGTYVASLGNVLVKYGHNASKTVLQNIAPTMLYGGLFSLLFALAQGQALRISLEPQYIGALLYLIVFGSIIGFASYLQLIGRIGSEKAAYATMINPIIALTVSSYMEGLSWSLSMASGVALILLGSVVVLSNFGKKTGFPTKRVMIQDQLN